MPLGLIIALIIGASIAFAAALVFFILRATRALHDKTVQVLEATEGIVKRSGRVATTLSLRNFSGTQLRASSMTTRRKAELILTRRGLVLVTPYAVRLGDAPYAQLTVKVNKAGVLHVKTEHPPEASGTIEAWVRLTSPLEWTDALGVPREKAY